MFGNRLRRGGVAVLGGAAIAVFAPFTGVTVSAAATETLTTDVLPGISSLTASPLDPSTHVQVGITMANPNAAAQNAAYEAIYTLGSPEYHQFLTPQQVADQFGLPEATFSQILTWATRDGMRPVYAANTREYLTVQGTASQAEQTFDVTLSSFQALGKSFYANTNGPTVPAGLGINGVIGLNNFLAAHTFNHLPPASAPHGATPAQSTCVVNCIGLTTPQDMWSIYNQPTDISNPSADFGQGQQMAVLGEGNVSGPLGDLRAFENEFSLPHIPITIASIGDDFSDTSGSGEWDIDSQASTGMSPKALGETWIFANDLTDSSVENLFSAFEAANGVMEANASFGECEEDPTTPVTGGGMGTGFGGLAGTAGAAFTASSENSLQQATLQGKTLFSSTGDTGSSCPVVFAVVVGAGNGVANQAYPETNYPASSQYAVAVGGTVLYSNPNTATPPPASNATRSMEYGWTFGGGGNTFYIPEPAYQTGIPFLDNEPCVSQPDGTPYATTTPCRGVPDVAAQSGDIASNGYAVNMGGTPDSQGAGTSLSSPLWMGMWARIQADTSLKNHGFYTNGFANVSLYAVGLNATEDPNDFFDIGAGPPSSPITNNGYYFSVPRTAVVDPSGWDYLSGLGSPNVCNLTKDIDGVANCDTTTNNLAQPTPADCGQPGLSSCVQATCIATGPLWTNPPHTATDLLGNTDPQLSLLQGTITLSGSNLIVKLTVTNLAETVPDGAAADEWYMLWSFGGTTYFANAELTSVAAAASTGPTYGDGTVVVTGTEHSYNIVNTNDTGSFTLGPNGVVEIDVPVANVGNPAIGADLQAPAGETDIEVGAPAVGGFLEKVDTGGPACDFVLGTGAVSPGPETGVAETPSPALLLGFGAFGLAGFVVRRRRATRRAQAR